MPVVLTYDFDTATADANDRNRINTMFKRLGWENIGGSAWRYPEFTTNHITEDWFNHAIPALMYFRSIVTDRGISVTNYSLDVQSSAGYRSAANIGQGILAQGLITMYNPNTASADGVLSEQRLKDWIGTCASGT